MTTPTSSGVSAEAEDDAIGWRYRGYFHGKPLPWQMTDQKWLANRQREDGEEVEPLYARPPPRPSSDTIGGGELAGAPTHRHVKTGHLVREIGIGFAQVSSHPIKEMSPVMIYEHGGKLWVRNMFEFDDGRFEELPALAASPHVDAPQYTGEPMAYLVVTNNTAWAFHRTREEAEHGAKNRLTYVKGCTSAEIIPLYAEKADNEAARDNECGEAGE